MLSGLRLPAARSSPIRIFCSRNLGTLTFEEIQTLDESHHSTILVLHGLLGSGRNWRSFSRALCSDVSSSRSSGWNFVLVDLRNHGRSADINGFDPPHNMFNAASDLAHLVRSQGWSWPDAVIGHSMGGKIALQFAQSCARGDYGDSAVTPRQLCVLDSVPAEVNPKTSDGEVEKLLSTIQSFPSSIPSRSWFVERLQEEGFSRPISEWVATNLKSSNEHLKLAINIDAAIQMFNSYRETSYWSVLENPPAGTEITVVVAEKSDRWIPEDLQKLRTVSNRRLNQSQGKLSLHFLPNSGHWVHVDNPRGLLQIVAPKIASLSS